MIEPWEHDWHGLAEWGDRPRTHPTIPALLTRARETHPDSELLVVDERRLTYGEMERRSASLAMQLLEAGVTKGCRVGLMLPNDESFPVTWMAIARIGAVAVCLPSLAKPPEIARIAAHADLHMLFAPRRYLHHDYAERLAEAFPDLSASRSPHRLVSAPHLRVVRFWCADGEDCPAWAEPVGLEKRAAVSLDLLRAAEASVHSSDAAAIIYTSGSTAEPKGVIHSHGNFVRQGLKLAVAFDYRPDERAFLSMPLFWVGGLTTTLMAVMAVGGTVLVSRKTGDELLDFIELEGTTAVVTWPHILRALAENPSFPARRWDAMRSGLFYEALPPDRRPADKSLMSTPIGMTETNGPYAMIDIALPTEPRCSGGRLMPGVEALLVDPATHESFARFSGGDLAADTGGRVGEIHLRSDVMMLGMVKRERAELFRDGWYPTGDLCSFREGHIHYHGRADDLIKAHGANVSPREVEAVLNALPGVASSSVLGIPDEERGTVVAAAVVPEPGVSLDEGTLLRDASRSLASYKLPRVIVVLSPAEVPMLASSKVDRLSLARLLSERRNAAAAS